MQKIYWHNDRFMVWRVKQLMEDNHIPCFIKNEFAIGAIGELSPMDIMPEVWLTNNDDEARANSLLADFSAQPVNQQKWKCSQCGEVNDANFAICWKCETSKPGDSQM